MQAKKSFGQHFLTDERISERIANSATGWGESYKHLLEVGPGKGMLSKYLLGKASEEKPLTMVEADVDMVEYLRKNFNISETGEFLDSKRLIFQDFLKLDFPKLFDGQVGIIGNFPYNISSQIVISAIQQKEMVPELVGMFQKEMAERVASPPGNKVYGVLSVLTQAHFDVEYLFSVKPGSFNPPPKVQSGVIRLVRKKDFNLSCDQKVFHSVVKTAFNQRRKMLRNTLAALLPKDLLNLDPFFTKRPEELGLEEFIKIAHLVEESRGNV